MYEVVGWCVSEFFHICFANSTISGRDIPIDLLALVEFISLLTCSVTRRVHWYQNIVPYVDANCIPVAYKESNSNIKNDRLWILQPLTITSN